MKTKSSSLLVNTWTIIFYLFLIDKELHNVAIIFPKRGLRKKIGIKILYLNDLEIHKEQHFFGPKVQIFMPKKHQNFTKSC